MPSIKMQLVVFIFYYVNWETACIYIDLHNCIPMALKLVIHQNT